MVYRPQSAATDNELRASAVRGYEKDKDPLDTIADNIFSSRDEAYKQLVQLNLFCIIGGNSPGGVDKDLMKLLANLTDLVKQLHGDAQEAPSTIIIESNKEDSL